MCLSYPTADNHSNHATRPVLRFLLVVSLSIPYRGASLPTGKADTMVAATKNRIAKSEAGENGNGQIKKTNVGVAIIPPQIKTLQLTLRGVTPLVVHQFSAKSRKEISDKEQQKAKAAREARNPRQEYLEAFYMMPGSPAPETKGARYGIPASGFKRACENVCGKTAFVTAIARSFATKAFFILDDGGGMIELKASAPRMRTDIVRIGSFGSKTPTERYRPEFEEWSCIIRVRYNAAAISAEQIVNIFMYAGLHEGWGEMRAGKGGSNGQWEVVTKQ